MRRLVKFAVMSVAVFQFCSAQITKNAIRVHAEQTTERYCEVDSVTASLLIGFKLSITNTQESAIQIDGSPYPTVLVSKTLDDLQKRKYEFTLHAPDLFSVPDESATKSEGPRILAPGDTLVIDSAELTFPVPVGTHYSRLEALSPGVHYAHLLFQAETTKRGEFVQGLSQPIRIVISRTFKAQNCVSHG